MAHGSLAGFWSTLSPGLDNGTLVLPMLTRYPLSQWTLRSGCNPTRTHTFFIQALHESHPPLLNTEFCDEPTRWHVWVHGLPDCGLLPAVWLPVALYLWKVLIMLFPGSFLSHAIQAQLCSVIVDRFLTWDIQMFTSHLIREAQKVRAAGWRWRTSCLAWNLPDRQHVWQGTRSSDIPPFCHHSSGFSSIPAWPWLRSSQPHSTTRSLFTSSVLVDHTHFQLPSADWNLTFPRSLLFHSH